MTSNSFLSTVSSLIPLRTGDYPLATSLLLGLGLLSFAKFLIKTSAFLLQTFILPGKSLKRYGAGKGAWAVVTGASEGIGREFALQLAAKGFNILAVARNTAALIALGEEIRSKYNVQTTLITLDCSKLDGNPGWAAAKQQLEGLDIGVLVNNVGRSHFIPVDFAETPEDEITNILNININATVQITRAIVPGMVNRKHGLIMSVGSFSGMSVTSPMLATYAGTKSFLASFSAALAEEVKGRGVDVETLNTYFVVSNLSKIRKPSVMIPTPKVYVKSVLSKIGLPCGAIYTGRPHVVTPFWSHSVLDYVMNLIGYKGFFTSYTHKLHKSIRKRALAKAARESKQQ